MKVKVQQHRICVVIGLLMCKTAHFAGLFLASTALLNFYNSGVAGNFAPLINDYT